MAYTYKTSINASLEHVFETVGNPQVFSQAVPQIQSIEFVSDQKRGVGTRFKETRVMNARQSTCLLEVTEYVENDRVRIVTDTHGCVWDSLFTVLPNAGEIDLTLSMEARPYKFISRVMMLFIKNGLQKALEADMHAVKSYCEQQRG